MSKPKRVSNFRLTDEHRVKIQNSNILSYLIAHIEGDREMSQTQVTAGVALLKKCLPDMSAIEHSGDADNPVTLKVTWQSEES